MTVVIYVLLIIIGVVAILAISHLLAMLKIINHLAEVNKRLLIVVAGKDEKPEALRALVALNKPPQGKLKGIADGKKEDKKPTNTDYVLEIGG